MFLPRMERSIRLRPNLSNLSAGLLDARRETRRLLADSSSRIGVKFVDNVITLFLDKLNLFCYETMSLRPSSHLLEKGFSVSFG